MKQKNAVGQDIVNLECETVCVAADRVITTWADPKTIELIRRDGRIYLRHSSDDEDELNWQWVGEVDLTDALKRFLAA